MTNVSLVNIMKRYNHVREKQNTMLRKDKDKWLYIYEKHIALFLVEEICVKIGIKSGKTANIGVVWAIGVCLVKLLIVGLFGIIKTAY